MVSATRETHPRDEARGTSSDDGDLHDHHPLRFHSGSGRAARQAISALSGRYRTIYGICPSSLTGSSQQGVGMVEVEAATTYSGR
ncbi:hypothetical protein GCM10009721_42820 [Terrabacter tumescens]|uniref:Uncharacterized protein n=1 Tax=Terrabacter tumescens TaxID=60443 RepID=A0ABQ2IG77_9MICO|nr:hypothetical protein GCM10009721_42820 [Terrabacter tumescens]